MRKEQSEYSIIRSKTDIMSCTKSMTDVAYDVLSKKKRAVQFNKLWEEVAKIYGASSDRIGKFYSDLSLDTRFVSLKENKWDLRERRKFEETHVNISEIELEDEEVEEIEDEGPSVISEADEY